MDGNRNRSLLWLGIGLLVVVLVVVGLSRGRRTALAKEPTIRVYLADQKRVQAMPMEEYVAAVVAGEMRNYWPREALAAQAIVARTFALKTLEEKRGKGPMGSDIQAGFKQAQEFKPENINDVIRSAVRETRGKVLTHNGKLVDAWFHSNAGGITALAKEGLNFRGPEPPYTVVKKSPDMTSDVPAEDRVWSATFSTAEIEAALNKIGIPVRGITGMTIARRGPSGRAQTITIRHSGGDVTIGGNDLRVALDPMRMRSNFITSLEVRDGQVRMSGKGFGHGVGMSQWGAHNMAKAGRRHEEICTYYFKDVRVEKRWA
ncbi:MAG: SpoIID/LytB domain-containing protein [Bacillota bacterium]|nr:SpoIID/LytB domain-containing protein [Bacillota bacterium]